MNAKDLLDNRTDVIQALFVLGIRPTLSTDDSVELMVGTRLDIGMLANKSEEPLDDARSLIL